MVVAVHHYHCLLHLRRLRETDLSQQLDVPGVLPLQSGPDEESDCLLTGRVLSRKKREQVLLLGQQCWMTMRKREQGQAAVTV